MGSKVNHYNDRWVGIAVPYLIKESSKKIELGLPSYFTSNVASHGPDATKIIFIFMIT